MRLTLAAGAFALAVFIAACGGSGKSGLLPSAVQSPTNTAPTPAASKTHVTVMLKIPPSTLQSHTRKPFFLSPNTQSIVFAIIPSGSGTPTPAQAQLFPIATPSPCAANATTGVETCTFNVQAPFGTDTFYVATFNVATPTTSTLPLASFVSGAIAVSSPSPGVSPTPIAFVMNGIVATVKLTVPSPAPSSSPNTWTFAAGVAATSEPLGVTPYDASNSPILSDGFDAPLTIDVAPANAGVALAINGTCQGSSGSGNTIQIGCAADLANVTFSYNGSITPDASNHITDTFSISATQLTSPAPSPATVVLASNVQTYVPNVGGAPYTAAALQSLPNNVVAYLESGAAATSAAYGTINATTGAVSTPITLSGTHPSGFYVMADGSIWVTDITSNSLLCYGAGGGTALATVPLSVTITRPDNITFDGVNLWWSGYTASGSDVSYAPLDATCALGVSTNFTLPSEIYEDAGLFLAPYSTGGVAVDGQNTGGFWKVTTAGPTYANPGFTAGAGFGGGVAVDALGTAYAAFNNDGGSAYISTLASGASTLAQLLSTPAVQFGALASFGPSAADRLAYVNGSYSTFDVIFNPHSSSPLLVPVNFANADYSDLDVSAAAFATDGTPFAAFYNNTTSTNTVGRALLTTTWSVPTSALQLDGVLGILERGDSGPFTVAPVGTPPACFTGISPVSNTDHAFFIGTTYITGSCALTVTVTDKNARTQTLNLTVPEPIS